MRQSILFVRRCSLKLSWFSFIPVSRKVGFSLLFAFTAFVIFSALRLPAQEDRQSETSTAMEKRSLDPLVAEERAYAERIARNDPQVKKLLGEAKIRVISVEPTLIKSESPERVDVTARYVEVVLFRPEGEVGARVTVNLGRKAVVQVQRLTGSQVPMTSDDLNEAFQLAIRDTRVQEVLGADVKSFQVQGALNEPNSPSPENLVTGLPLRSTDPKDPCSKHRCLELFFRRGVDFLSGPSVIADLTAKRLYVERRKPR
jgi:hypothetical protein